MYKRLTIYVPLFVPLTQKSWKKNLVIYAFWQKNKKNDKNEKKTKKNILEKVMIFENYNIIFVQNTMLCILCGHNTHVCTILICNKENNKKETKTNKNLYF